MSFKLPSVFEKDELFKNAYESNDSELSAAANRYVVAYNDYLELIKGRDLVTETDEDFLREVKNLKWKKAQYRRELVELAEAKLKEQKIAA